jgi:hypothetical protein
MGLNFETGQKCEVNAWMGSFPDDSLKLIVSRNPRTVKKQGLDTNSDS